MRLRCCLALILFTSAGFAQTASVNQSSQAELVLPDEGDVVSNPELIREIHPDKDHPLPRKLIAVQEGELSCAPAPQKILLAHYRAEPPSRLSLNDDRILIAVKEDDKFEILKVLNSDTVVVDGNLYSDGDFEGEFIDINGMHFLYIQRRVAGSGGIVENDVYTISSDQKLTIIPFQDTKSRILKENEELRHGGYRFADGAFTFESGIYQPRDSECCPSLGSYRAQFRLEGGFKKDAEKHAFEPDFKFVVADESRGNDR
jgi:hypothetical protein